MNGQRARNRLGRAAALMCIWVLVAAVALAGCGQAAPPKQEAKPAPKPEEKKQRDNVLIVAAGGDLDSAMWTQSGMFLMDQLLTWMGEPLVFYHPDGTIKPALAERWESSADGLTYTFYLNKKAKWHDGKPVTAKDVAFTIELTIYPETPSGGGPSLLLKGADDFAKRKTNKVAGIEIIDDYTIKLSFATKSGQVMSVLAADSILPYHILGQVPLDKMAEHAFNTAPIYCGPYKMTRWTKGSEMVFERFADYFGLKPPFDRIIYRIIPEASTQIAELKAGKVHVLMSVPVQDFKDVSTTKGIAGFETKGAYGRHVLINQNRAEWKNVKTRQALSYLFDWQAVLNGMFNGKGVLSVTLFHPDNWEYNKNLKPYEYNVTKAKTLLAESGWKDIDNDGILEAQNVRGVPNGQKFKVTLPVTTKAGENICLILAEQLKKVGIDAKVEMYEATAYRSQIYAPGSTKWDLIYAGWGNSFVGAWPSSRGFEVNFGGVGTLQHKREGWDDTQLAKMIDDVLRVPDLKQAKPMWDAIQARVHDNVYRIHALRENAFICYNADLNVDLSEPIWDIMWLKFGRNGSWKDIK